MKRQKRLIIGGFAFLAALMICACFDKQIIYFVSSLRTYTLSQFFLGIKFLDADIFVVLFLTLILLRKREKREWIFPMWATILITGLATFVLKYSIQRPRPFAQNLITLLPGIADKASYHTWDFSFPSFDTAFVFCGIPIVWKFFPRFRYIWLSFSVLVGLSRVYFGVHFLSDVIFGAAMGLLIGALIIKEETERGSLKKIYLRTTRLFRKK